MDENTPTNQSFTQRTEEVKNSLFTYIMVRTGFNSGKSEQIFLDAVSSAQKAYAQFDESKVPFRVWIYSLAQAIFPVQAEDSDEILVSSEFFGLDEDTKSISGVLMKMKEGERELLCLRHIQEFGFDEISAITGKKQGAIRTALSRTLNRFVQLSKKSS